MTARCLVGGCDATFTGPELERDAQIEAHRLAAHPWVKQGRLTSMGAPVPGAPEGEE